MMAAVPRRPTPGKGRSQAHQKGPLRFALALLVLAFAAYAQVREHGFVNIDDPHYVFENPTVRNGLSPGAVGWAFTTGHAGNWHPLTWISHMADVSLFGLDPGAHHVVNVVFHAASTVLLFLALARMTGAAGASAFAAGLFALHPLHVESVAWVAERKDVLSAFFWTLAMLLYARYAARPTTARYLSVTAAFAAALMSKPTAVTLPIVLLLADYWPLARERAWPCIREKLPWLAMSTAAGIVTLLVQKQAGAVQTLDIYPLSTRVANAGVAYMTYLVRTVWPTGLAPLYPYEPPVMATAALAWSLFAAISLLAFLGRRSFPAGAIGWAWYVVTLMPMIGFIQVGAQPSADRYTYIPLIGIFIALAWGLKALLIDRLALPSRVALTAAAAVLVGLSALTWRQTGVWKDSITLWRHAVDTHGNYRARANLGQALNLEGRFGEALFELNEAVRINPAHAESQHRLGFALAETGDRAGAITRYREAVRLKPQYQAALANLGIELAQAGEFDEAIIHLREALRLDPDSRGGRENLALALMNKGIAHEERGERDAALAAYREALQLLPAHTALADRIRSLETSR